MRFPSSSVFECSRLSTKVSKLRLYWVEERSGRHGKERKNKGQSKEGATAYMEICTYVRIVDSW